MQACARGIAGLLAALFVPLAAIALMLASLQGFLLDAQALQAGLRESGLYERAPAVLAAEVSAALAEDPCSLLAEVCESGLGAVLEAVPRPSWEKLISQVMTPAWLQAQIEPNLEALMDLLVEGRSEASLRISLVEPRQVLAEGLGADLAEGMLAALPPCTERQLVELALRMQQGGEIAELLVCQPPPEIMIQVRPLMQSALADGIEGVPDRLELDLRGLEGAAAALARPLRILRTGVVISAAGALMLLVLIGLLAVRSWREALIWWGVPLMLAGLNAWALGYFGPSLAGFILGRTLAAGGGQPMPAIVLPLMREMIAILIESAMASMRNWALALTVAGALMIILSRLVGPRTSRLREPLNRV